MESILAANKSPGRVFLELLSSSFRLGWYHYAPGSIMDLGIAPRIKFHIHVDDVSDVQRLLESAIASYGGTTQWKLVVGEVNRFALFPDFFNFRGESPHSTEETEEGRQANKDLLLLAEYVQKVLKAHQE